MRPNFLGGRRLLLTGDGQAWLWLVAGAAALALVLILYRYERKLVSRANGLVLLSLRLVAALALVFALFNPIAQVSTRETVRGRVIVGVDLSESMATTDPGRPVAERERLRKVLRLGPGEAVERLPRREIARRLLRGDLLQQIRTTHDISAFGFARDAVPGTVEALDRALTEAPSPDDRSALTTDWLPALEAALQSEGAAPVLGVVLLTDGRRNAPGDPDPLADRLAARGVPVYPIVIGTTAPPRDAAIAALKAPDGVYQDDTAQVEVTLKLDGPPAGTEVPVTLDRPGASPLRKTVRVPADGSRPIVVFPVPLHEVGSQTLTVAVGPVEGDVRPDNDRRAVTLQVADDKAKVLLVDGEARWEFRYLRNALARDPRATIEAVIFHQPRSESSSETSYKSAWPVQADALGAFDAVVLGDLDPADLPPEAWAQLDAYVAGRGGTLVLVAGPRSWQAFLGQETVRKLLPIRDPRPVAFDSDAIDPAHPSLPAGVAVVPHATATADAWPMLQFAADADRNRAIWSALPGLPWVLPGRAKPAATVLATAGDDQAVIAASPYGLGKVLYIGTDATWRWRHRVGDAYHHRFWGQVVRWAATGGLSAGNRLVRFGPEKPKIAEGEGVVLRARFADEAAGVGPELLVAARVFKAEKPSGHGPRPMAKGEAVAVVPLRAQPGQPRAFEGAAPGLPAGSYVVRLDVPQLDDARDGEGPVEAAFEVAPRETSERIELAASRDALDRLASATAGRVFADHEADGLPALIRGRTLVTVRTEETPLWDRPLALVLFFGMLTLEWVLRKRAGLP